VARSAGAIALTAVIAGDEGVVMEICNAIA
jgi:hypothetical protein